jgi:aspartate carbamoyltransferase regulatory subunit
MIYGIFENIMRHPHMTQLITMLSPAFSILVYSKNRVLNPRTLPNSHKKLNTYMKCNNDNCLTVNTQQNVW